MPATKSDGNKPAGTAKFESAVTRLSDLPTIPNTLLRIWQLVDDPDSSASDLEKVITMDQTLTAKIIRLVNSPYYGVREPVSSCRQAVTLLGFETVKNLSICVSVVSACAPEEAINPELELRELWKHSMATGVAAEEIARRIGVDDPDAAFTAGVLHDIGKFVMNLTLRSDYGEALRTARDGDTFLREAETAVFGVDHQYFGAHLARLWGFPASLVEAIEKHHQPLDALSGTVASVSVANAVARALGIGSSGDAKKVHLDPATLSAVGLDCVVADEFLDEIRTRVNDARDVMNLLG